MIGVRRDTHLPGKVVRRSQGNDPQRHVVAVEPIDHLVDGPVASDRDYCVHAAVCGAGRERGARTRVEREVRLDEVALVPNPVDEVPEIRAVGALPVDDQRHVLTTHAIR